MKLKKLIAQLPIQLFKGSKEIEITGLCAHSKFVAPGNLFIAKMGTKEDGTTYIDEAIDAGALAILSDFPDPSRKSITQLVCQDVPFCESKLADRFYASPSKELFTVGVTGTNGKTTVTYLIKHLLDHLNHSTGLIGTIEYVIGDYHFEAELTTPDVITNHKMLREMVKHGCSAVAMEVSSHALAQNRVDQIAYDVAVFTNLSQDHLDYHKTMEEYAHTKARLFKNLSPKSTAVISLDGMDMVKESLASQLTYGLSPQADLFALDLQFSPAKTQFTAHFQNEHCFCTIPLVGRFNVLNALAAIGVCLAKGYRLEEVTKHLNTFPQVRGRLERVGSHIYVDYAHTPDALEKVLSSLFELKKGRIITVFGAGGDRDKQKRREMGSVVSKWSNLSILTSDNPRSEDPKAICDEIALGCTNDYFIELDRRKAIERAIALADPQDLILIAGKGHETYQIFAHQTLPFDDRKVILESLDEVRCH